MLAHKIILRYFTYKRVLLTDYNHCFYIICIPLPTTIIYYDLLHITISSLNTLIIYQTVRIEEYFRTDVPLYYYVTSLAHYLTDIRRNSNINLLHIKYKCTAFKILKLYLLLLFITIIFTIFIMSEKCFSHNIIKCIRDCIFSKKSKNNRQFSKTTLIEQISRINIFSSH